MIPALLGGSAHPAFGAVRDRFAESIADGTETGAAVAVYRGDELVVDLWGGWADQAMRAEVLQPVAEGHDALLDRSVAWGMGLKFDEGYAGTGGIGGPDGEVNLERGFAFGYVTRHLGNHDRAISLTDTVESCLAVDG